MYKIAIVSTHPIQYQTPFLQALSNHPSIDLTVLYCHHATPTEQAKAGFGVEFDWDKPLLDGYKYRFLKNVARNPSINHFFGLDTPEVENIITLGNFDAVIVSGWIHKAAWQTFRACWKTKTPVMVRGDSHLYTHRGLLKQILKYPFYRWFLGKMDACLAVGKWSYDYYVHYGVAPDRIFLVPHVVDENHFSSLDIPLRLSLKVSWEIPENAVVFLFCGKLTHVKRPLDFIRAIQIAQTKNPNLVGLIVGDGPLRAKCEAIVRENSIRIKFVGFLNQSEIPRAYHLSNCIVLTSEGETWGLVVNEAMLSGLPALVSDTAGCWPDLVISSKTGYTYPMANVDQLVTKMLVLAEDVEKTLLMGNQARNHVKQFYGLEQAVNGVLFALERVTNQTND